MKEKMRARRTAGKGCCIVIVAFVSLIIFGRQARRQAERKEGGGGGKQDAPLEGWNTSVVCCSAFSSVHREIGDDDEDKRGNRMPLEGERGRCLVCFCMHVCVCTRVFACGGGCERLADDDMR